MGVDVVEGGRWSCDDDGDKGLLRMLADFARDDQHVVIEGDPEAHFVQSLDSIDVTAGGGSESRGNDSSAPSTSLLMIEDSLTLSSPLEPLGEDDVAHASAWWDAHVNKKRVAAGEELFQTDKEISIMLEPVSSGGESSSASTCGSSPMAYTDGTASPAEMAKTIKAAYKGQKWEDEQRLTPLEIRRKRNRESMQRARRKQRDELEKMRDTLQILEQHYQKLSEEALERRSMAPTADSAITQHLEENYYNLADLSHALQEEKFLLEQQLTEKQKTYRRMQQVMVDREQELGLPTPLSIPDWSLFSDFDFVPITEDQASERIRQCYERIRQSEETAGPLTHPSDETDTTDAARSTFGWKVTCQITVAHEFFVCFSKFFPGVTPEVAMERSWARYSNRPSSAKFTPSRSVARYELLQVLNDSAYVVGMDFKHPVKEGKFMRGFHLSFKLHTENGCAMGRATVNPNTPELRKLVEENSPIEFVDSSNLIEFIDVIDETTGTSGCRIKWYARTDYNTQEDTYVRVLNALSGMLMWESAIIATPLKLLPT